ncbi:MAG: radical SAM family heme chaperone HemW [Myxococcota bacterium]
MRVPASPEDFGVYVHFPFCASKCPYCDFNSHVADHDDEAYADVILQELERRRADCPDRPARTVFFGGGTPSRWAPRSVGRVLAGIEACFGLDPEVEITLEANPGSVEQARLADFAASGINRFSIGCQSFDDHELAWLGRQHSGDAAHRAVESALATGARVSLDIMYGLPGQSEAAALRTAELGAGLGVEHVAAYALVVEPQTVLAHRVALKVVQPMADDDQAELYQLVTARLEARGLARYEVSNYAQPGKESLHNALYWLGARYLGLGAGAHGYLNGYRYENLRSPTGYGRAVLQGDSMERDRRPLDALEALKDRCTVALRSRWGIEKEAFRNPCLPHGAEGRVREALSPIKAAGWIAESKHRWYPTEQGYAFSDACAVALLGALDRG